MRQEHNVNWPIWKQIVDEDHAGSSELTRMHVYRGGGGTQADHKVIEIYAATAGLLFRASLTEGSGGANNWTTNYKSASTAANNMDAASALLAWSTRTPP